jgi:DNA polymerase-3 subunit delta
MKNNNKSVTFVYGSDDFLVDRRSRALFNAICGGNGEILYADNRHDLSANMKSIVSYLTTTPLFADCNAMWLRGVCFCGEKTLSEEEKISAALLLDALKSDHGKNVIISSAAIDRRTKIFKDLTQFAENVDLDAAENSRSLETIIAEFAADSGVGIDAAAVQLLRMKCGNNARLLEQEIEKLAMYVLGQRRDICEGDVAAIVCDYDGGNFFEPVEKFFSGSMVEIFQSIDGYFFCNGDARPLLSALQSRNRILIQLRALIDAKRIRICNGGMSKGDFAYAAKFFHMDAPTKTTFNVFSQNIWFVSKLIPVCMKFKLSRLLRFQAAFSSALVGTIERYNEQKTVLKELVLKCLSHADCYEA